MRHGETHTFSADSFRQSPSRGAPVALNVGKVMDLRLAFLVVRIKAFPIFFCLLSKLLIIIYITFIIIN